jgi:hypothetical protein
MHKNLNSRRHYLKRNEYHIKYIINAKELVWGTNPNQKLISSLLTLSIKLIIIDPLVTCINVSQWKN